jgi:predicted ABC-type transport system involved in lysophospholipase L1 biosynthesis ATPase subunit
VWGGFVDWKEITFLNSAISKFRKEVARETGSPARPTTTGFRDYALNRIRIAVAARAIGNSLDTKIPSEEQVIGDLGSGKGELKFVTQYCFQNGKVTDGNMNNLGNAKKTVQKKFANALREIIVNVFSDDLFQKISALNEVDDVDDIKSVYEMLLFRRYFTLDGLPYTPSSGESSMVMLQRELGEDKDIYILDEPERSLGNEYINDVIVPLIKGRAKLGRRIFIATHDANIAVRTLPYCSIFRTYGAMGYGTYIGNPFSNNLVNVENPDDRLDWKAVSMRTLEGGKDAFGERGKISGHA